MTTLTHILRTARAGNPARALRLFAERGFDKAAPDPKILTLKGRLLKDQAKRSSGAARRDLFGEARRAYEAAFALDASSYALINAAALACLSGDGETSRTLAAQTLAMIERDPDEGETAYWREATRAEALLLLDRGEEGKVSLANAITQLPHAYEDHAATIGQFELIIAQQNGDPEWLEHHRPPASLHFSGMIGLDEHEAGLKDRIKEAIEAARPGFAFGALAAGADIVLAETCVAAGAELRVHLPCEPDAFRRVSVEPFGAQWGARFDRVLAQAATLDILPPALNDTPRPFESAIDLSDLWAMGACLRQASVLRSRAGSLTIHGRGEAMRDNLGAWQNFGHPVTCLEANRVAGHPKTKRDAHGVKTLASVLALETIDAETKRAASQLGLLRIERGERVFLIGEPGACLTLLTADARSLGDRRAGFMMDTQKVTADNASVLDRAEHLLDAAGPATILADHLSASVASVLVPSLVIEELGEMRTLQGAISVWSILG